MTANIGNAEKLVGVNIINNRVKFAQKGNNGKFIDRGDIKLAIKKDAQGTCRLSINFNVASDTDIGGGGRIDYNFMIRPGIVTQTPTPINEEPVAVKPSADEDLKKEVKELKSTPSNTPSNDYPLKPDPTPSSNKAIATDPEKKAWEAAKKTSNCASIQEYLDKYPKGSYQDEAYAELNRICKLTADYVIDTIKQVSVITVGGVYGKEKPELTISDDGDLAGLEITPTSNSKYEVNVPLGKIISVRVNSGNRNKVLTIDRTKEMLSANFVQIGNKLAIKSISGGKPPYFVAFKSAGILYEEIPIGAVSETTIDLGEIGTLKIGDKYDVELRDIRKMEHVLWDGLLSIPLPRAMPAWMKAFFFLGTLSIVILLFIHFRNMFTI
ncbi:MAG: hypothetical protein IPM82_07355 [Saprospiraceae bacterium]|nr:hypothetical protein [Saprospiraceae bacterium]